MRRARPAHAPRIIEEFHGCRSGARGQARPRAPPIHAHNCGQFAAVLPATCGISVRKSEFLQRHDPPPIWPLTQSLPGGAHTMPLIRFLHDRTAGVAPLLGICIIPLAIAMGAAIDYSRAASVHTSMQMALDSTALMLSKEAQNLTPDQLGSKATTYFNALFNRPEVSNVQITQEFGS